MYNLKAIFSGESGYGNGIIQREKIDMDFTCISDVDNFIRNDIRRYTIVFWLEGYDPQSRPDEEHPEGATLKLGVDISAYEKTQS